MMHTAITSRQRQYVRMEYMPPPASLSAKNSTSRNIEAQPCNVDQCKQKPPPLAAERSEGEPPARGLCLLGFVTVFYIALCHESTPVFPVAREFLSHE